MEHLGFLQELVASEVPEEFHNAATTAMQKIRARLGLDAVLAEEEPEPQVQVLAGQPDSPQENNWQTDQESAAAAAEVQAESDPLMLEQQDLHEALLKSKADGPPPVSYDDMVIFRLIRTCDEAQHALNKAQVLSNARQRVEDAQCSVRPEGANNAFPLVPLTREQVPDIEEALKKVNPSRRPKVRDDRRTETMDEHASAAGPGKPQATSINVIEEIELLIPKVRSQLLEFMVRNGRASEPSERSMKTASAPTGDAERIQPMNPRYF